MHFPQEILRLLQYAFLSKEDVHENKGFDIPRGKVEQRRENTISEYQL